jgi:hypothetical protein
MGLGSLNDIGLAEAREIARKCRNFVIAGRDPITERDAEVARNLAGSAILLTFEKAAEAYIAQHRGGAPRRLEESDACRSMAGEFKNLCLSYYR